ncbi:MAG: ABC transporter ATP-binding protein [Bacilli bacterium]|nr:ABC transporter ATP-binding protein [Bacilli bacterium]
MKIRLKKISKYYYDQGKSTKALENISLDFATDGSFVVITGESGAGKSSLIKVITGLEEYDEGEIFFDDIPLSSLSDKQKQQIYADNISFVFQDYNLVESISGLENINLALIKQGKNKKEAQLIATKSLNAVGLNSQIHQRVSKLSGGERQRVAIARSLALDTPIIVFDEPTGNLDNETSKTIIDLIEKIGKDKLILYVTHDYDIVSKYVTRHIVLSDGHLIKDEQIIKHQTIDDSMAKRQIKNHKFSAFSYLYSTYLIGFKRFGRMISTFLVLLFAYAGILGSFYGYANGVISSNNVVIFNTDYNQSPVFNMGNVIYNQKNTIDEKPLTFDQTHFTDYGRDLDSEFSLISPALNEKSEANGDLISPEDDLNFIKSIDVTILPYYDADDSIKFISGSDNESNYINLVIPENIEIDSYYFDRFRTIAENEFSISCLDSFFSMTDDELAEELAMRPKASITGLYSYNSDKDASGDIYLICNFNFLNQVKTYVKNIYGTVSFNSNMYSVKLANSELTITSDDKDITGIANPFSYSENSFFANRLYLSSDLENSDITIMYKKMEIPLSSFNVEYVDFGISTSNYFIYTPALNDTIRKMEITSTSYFPTASVAIQQYDKYKDDYPRMFCPPRTNSNFIDYSLNILSAPMIERVGYLSLFVIILAAIILIAFLIKSIINRFYYRKSYDQKVLHYIGYSFKDIVVINLIEFLSLSFVSIIIVCALFLSLVPKAFLIFSTNSWLLILAIIFSILCAVLFALPRRKKAK